jgi:hypothetical protein
MLVRNFVLVCVVTMVLAMGVAQLVTRSRDAQSPAGLRVLELHPGYFRLGS